MTAIASVAAAVWNTTSGTKSSAGFTPAVGDLLVVITGDSGNTSATPPTDDNADGLGTYALAVSALSASSADQVAIWIRNALIGSATSTIVTHAPGVTTGGGLRPYKITPMTRFGADAIRRINAIPQVGSQDNQTASTTPAPAFPAAGLTGNSVLGVVINGSSPAGMTAPASWGESADVGYSTPTTGLEIAARDSGNTLTTITWGSTSATAFGCVIVEFDASAAFQPRNSAVDVSSMGVL